MTETKLMSVGEAAKFLNISPRKVYQMAKDGELPHFRLGRTIRFSPVALSRLELRRGADD